MAMRVFSDSWPPGEPTARPTTRYTVPMLRRIPIMMRLSSSVTALSVAAMLCIAAGNAAAQEIIPATPTPGAAMPRWLSRLWPFSLSAPAPDVPAPASTSTPTPLSTQLPLIAVPASTDGQAAQRGTLASRLINDNLPWSELTEAQRAALGPLAGEWASLDRNGRQKWLDVAKRLPRLSATKQVRMQRRMADWARMTPRERAQVRLRFEQAKRLAPQHRRESWDAYLALPVELRHQLAERAAMAAPAAPAKSAFDAGRRNARAERIWRDVAQTKSNIVVVPAQTPPLRPVAPTVVQVQPGATTTLMSKRPTPPAHQQVGLPKIAATPEFVDTATLLPQRGAQGAAMHVISASEPAPRR